MLGMFKRRLTKIMIDAYQDEKHLLVTGARQVGKSTLIQTLLANMLQQEMFVFNFDDPDLRLDLSHGAIQKISSVPHQNIMFDEVQKFPEILDAIKYVIDHDAQRHCFITGSAQVLLLKSVQESLAGRVGLWNLYPLAYSELFDDRSELLIDKIIDNPTCLNDFDDYQYAKINEQKTLLLNHQRWGGYPAVMNLNKEDLKFRWLSHYKKTYLEKDIIEIKSGVDVRHITKFQNILALRTGQLISYSDIARDCGISTTTSQNYMRLFELTFQVALLQPYFRNQTKRMVKSPKAYFLDTGLARVITGEFHQATLSGAMYETWVFTELLKWAAAKQIPPQLFFYRSAAGFEVDFLVESAGGRLLPIEVKTRDTLRLSDAAQLTQFLKENPEIPVGIMIYPGDKLTQLSPKIWAIPDRLFFL